ncbi:pseudouridine synthase [Archaeoglobales archaeon]|nr:MAG: pseudouridine synthase [Archaeoglobales archaeon]
MSMKRLRKKEAKKVINEISKIGVEIKGNMDVVNFGDADVILVDNEPLILKYDDRYYLTVYGVIKFKPEKNKVVVDEGALKFIMNGADVMRPGIVYADENIKKDDFVYVVVEGKETPISVGVALVNGKEMIGERGKAVKNIHHLKDKIWKYFFR